MVKSEVAVQSAAGVIRQLQSACEWYAGDFAPIRTDQVAGLLGAYNCALEVFPFVENEDGTPIDPAFVLPPFRGVSIICVDKKASRMCRQFCIRHELAHVAAGEVTGPTYLSDSDFMSHSERVADLVALADLLPAWSITAARRARQPWRRIQSELADAIAFFFAEEWGRDRLEDRASLRLQLYRSVGI